MQNGFVINSKLVTEGEHRGEYLNLVRGTGNTIVPKIMVNTYIKNGFSLAPRTSYITCLQYKGRKFAEIKKMIEESDGILFNLTPKLPGRKSWTRCKVLHATGTQVILQKVKINGEPLEGQPVITINRE